MLELARMSKGDAIHNLKVLAWLQENQQHLEAIANQPICTEEVSADEAQSLFAEPYTSLESTRFFPLTVTLSERAYPSFHDTVIGIESPDPLEHGQLEYQGSHQVDDLTKCIGISGDEKTWRVSNE